MFMVSVSLGTRLLWSSSTSWSFAFDFFCSVEINFSNVAVWTSQHLLGSEAMGKSSSLAPYLIISFDFGREGARLISRHRLRKNKDFEPLTNGWWDIAKQCAPFLRNFLFLGFRCIRLRNVHAGILSYSGFCSSFTRLTIIGSHFSTVERIIWWGFSASQRITFWNCHQDRCADPRYQVNECWGASGPLDSSET